MSGYYYVFKQNFHMTPCLNIDAGISPIIVVPAASRRAVAIKLLRLMLPAQVLTQACKGYENVDHFIRTENMDAQTWVKLPFLSPKWLPERRDPFEVVGACGTSPQSPMEDCPLCPTLIEVPRDQDIDPFLPSPCMSWASTHLRRSA